MALQGAPPAELDQIAGALEEIEAIVNGSPRPSQPQPTPFGRLLADAADRYRELATAGQVRIDVVDQTADARPILDRTALTSAVDNLIANAVEHGEGPIEIRAAASEKGAELTIRNATGNGAASSSRGDSRGHGLEIVAEVARRNGGRFEFRREGNDAVAMLALDAQEPLTEAS